jgi:phage shock protein C
MEAGAAPALGQAASARPGRNDMPLYRSRRHKVIAGVCGGLADWLGWDPTVMRIAYVILSIISVGFPGTIAYIILWIVMPKEPIEPPPA